MCRLASQYMDKSYQLTTAQSFLEYSSTRFKAQIRHIENKTRDRLNVLKSLSFNKLWRINKNLLVNIYKSLVRSVLDYSSFVISSISHSLIKKLEKIQYEAIGIILRKSVLDKISATNLREQVGLDSVEDRLNEITRRYLEKALANMNPLIDQMHDDYLDFKNRNLINPGAAGNDNQLKKQIEAENMRRLELAENPPTFLCTIEDIREMRSDNMPLTKPDLQVVEECVFRP